MESLHDKVYSASVVEFVTVAKELLLFLTTSAKISREEFVDKLQKFIPLIYLKGTMLPVIDSDEEAMCEDAVTEDEYNTLFALIKSKMGEYDDYLEIFDDVDGFHEEPVVHTVSEKISDIYQDLKNFVHSYKSGVDAVMGEAIWNLNNNFDLYWGKACAEVLRAIHLAKCKSMALDSYSDDSDDEYGFDELEEEYGVEEEY